MLLKLRIASKPSMDSKHAIASINTEANNVHTMKSNMNPSLLTILAIPLERFESYQMRPAVVYSPKATQTSDAHIQACLMRRGADISLIALHHVINNIPLFSGVSGSSQCLFSPFSQLFIP